MLHGVIKSLTASLLRKRPSAGWKNLCSFCLLLFSLLFFWGATAVDIQQSYYRDLQPDPDAEEYFAAAWSLHREGTYTIHLAGVPHPPRYPFGYSLLMLPFFRLGIPPMEVPFLVNRLAGVLLLLLLFAFLAGWGAPLEAGLACLLLVSLPAFLLLGRSSLSDLTGSMPVALAFLLMAAHLRGGSFAWALAASALLGLSVCFRISNGLFLLLPAAPLIHRLRGAPFRRLLLLYASFGTGMLPILCHQWFTFGSPLQTGYSYWVPYWAELGNAFQVRHLPLFLDYLIREALQRENSYRPSGYFGFGSYFGPFWILLGLVSVWPCRRRRWLLSLGLPALAYMSAMAFYFYQDARLYLPLLILVAPLAALMFPRLLRGEAPGWRGWILRGGVLLLLLGQIFDYTRSSKPEAVKYWKDGGWQGQAVKYEAVQRLARLLQEEGEAGQGVLVLADMDPPYVHSFLPVATVVSPLDEDHNYRFTPKFQYGPEDRAKQVRRYAQAGRGVWVVLWNTEPDHLPHHCPPPPGFRWKERFREGKSAVFVLTPEREERESASREGE